MRAILAYGFQTAVLAALIAASPAVAEDSGSFVFQNAMDAELQISIDGTQKCDIAPGGQCSIHFDSSTAHTFGYSFSGQYHTTQYQPSYSAFEHCTVGSDGPQCHSCKTLMCDS